MIKILILVGFVAVASVSTVGRLLKNDLSSSEVRVVGGDNTTIENVPYQVSVRRDGHHHCGGSIISKYWLLTSIHHCVNSLDSRYTIVAGTADLENGGSTHSIASIIRHENYGAVQYKSIPYNDIALIRVNEPFILDKTRQPIPLIDENKETPAGVMSVITGWRKIHDRFMPNLQTVSVPIVDKTTCKVDYKDIIVAKLPVTSQICAGDPKYHKGSYDIDEAGGPLVVDGRLTGIFSWGIGEALPQYPGIYTEVSAFRDWIRNKTTVENSRLSSMQKSIRSLVAP